MVKLKVGGEVHNKHIDELTREDREARIAAEMEEVEWLKRRLELHKERNQQEGLSYGRSPEDA